MRPLRAGVCFWLLALPCLAPPALPGQQPLQHTPYYPLQVGNSWYYRAGEQKVRVSVTAHEDVKSVRCARVEATDGTTTKVEHLASLKDGVYQYRNEGKDVTPPRLLLKLPVKEGDTWKVESEADGVKVQGTFKAGTETDVHVPAGRFPKAVTVSCDDLQIGARRLSVTWWFVEGVGMVKQRVRIDGAERTLELEKYQVKK